jgi:glycosyltransferase involved in cell wall biosynthesis
MSRTDRPIRVAIVAPSLGILGGQAVQASRLLAGWHRDPHVRAWLVPVNPVPPGPLRHLLRVKYARTMATQATYWPTLVRELRRADVVHVFSASYFSFLLAPLPAILVARLLGRPVVLNYRSGEAPDHLRRSAVARSAVRWCERNAVPSSFLAGVFAEHGIPTRVIPNTVDLERFAFRARVPLRPALVSTRNLEPMYNVGLTLEAFRQVQAKHPDATLTLVGAGSQEAPLKALATRLGLRGVTFLGRLSPERMPEAYAEADIYVQTPEIDNMPSSVLEAFASGTPVVATRVGGVPAILEDGLHGLLAPPGDAGAVAGQILRLLREPDLASRLAAAARESCDRYRWPHVRAQWLGLYRELVAVGAPAGAEVPTT